MTRTFFGGRVVREISVPSGRVAEIVSEGGVACPPHAHPRPFFSRLLEGAYREGLDRALAVDHQPGDVYFHDGALVHRDAIPSPRARFLIAEFSSSLLTGVGDLAPIVRGDAEIELLASRLRRSLWTNDPAAPASRFIAEGLLLQMVGTLIPPTPGRQSPPWLLQVDELLRCEYLSSLSVKAIAARVGVPPARLSRAFKSAYGESIADRVWRLRVEHAVRRMRHPPGSLAAIAAESGFADQAQLTRMFRQVLGTTPGRFRREIPAVTALGDEPA